MYPQLSSLISIVDCHSIGILNGSFALAPRQEPWLGSRQHSGLRFAERQHKIQRLWRKWRYVSFWQYCTNYFHTMWSIRNVNPCCPFWADQVNRFRKAPNYGWLHASTLFKASQPTIRMFLNTRRQIHLPTKTAKNQGDLNLHKWHTLLRQNTLLVQLRKYTMSMWLANPNKLQSPNGKEPMSRSPSGQDLSLWTATIWKLHGTTPINDKMLLLPILLVCQEVPHGLRCAFWHMLLTCMCFDKIGLLCYIIILLVLLIHCHAWLLAAASSWTAVYRPSLVYSVAQRRTAHSWWERIWQQRLSPQLRLWRLGLKLPLVSLASCLEALQSSNETDFRHSSLTKLEFCCCIAPGCSIQVCSAWHPGSRWSVKYTRASACDGQIGT